MALMNAVNVADGGGTTLKKNNSNSNNSSTSNSNTASPNNVANNSSTSNQTNSTTSSAAPLVSNTNVGTSTADTFNYAELKRNVTKIIDYLQKSSNNLQRTINDLNSYYVVNGGRSELQSQLETLKKDIIKTSDYLSSNVITEINKKI